MSPTELRIATRTSALATAQAQHVGTRLASAHPGLDVSLVGVETTGDKDRISSVTALTEMGAFVRSVQAAVLDGRADVAVHSCKDLPVRNPDGLVLAAFPERADVADALVGATLDELPEGARVGTGSPRRTAQLRLLRPDLRIEGIRGNIDTRVRLATEGPFDAVVLAAAGLVRLGWETHIAQRFTLDEMVPAPAQGILALETASDGAARALVEAVDDPAVRVVAETERLLLEITGAGCRSAMGAVATVEDGGTIRLVAFTDDDKGPRRAEVTGPTPLETAQAAATELGL